jgi:hypothetical protein
MINSYSLLQAVEMNRVATQMMNRKIVHWRMTLIKSQINLALLEIRTMLILIVVVIKWKNLT